MDKQLVISIRTIILTLMLILSGYVIYRLAPIFGTLLLATLLVIALEPLVKYFMSMLLWNKPVSRGIAVFFTYAIFFLVVAFLLTVALPPVLIQVRVLLVNLSQIMQNIGLPQFSSISLTDFLPSATSVSNGVINLTFSLFSNITAIFSLVVLSIYMSLDWNNLKERLYEILPERLEMEFKHAIEEIELNIGHWVKGQLLLMLAVGFLSFIGLSILGVKYALALALISGLLEVVPIIGPIISAVIAAVIGFSDVSYKGFGAIILYVIIQQAENNILVPKIMEKVSGFSPLAILIALLVGSEFFGILGAVMAVPVTMILAVIVKRILNFKG